MHFGIRDVMVLVYRVILQEHVLLQGSCDLMDRSPWYKPKLQSPGLVIIDIDVAEILFCFGLKGKMPDVLA